MILCIAFIAFIANNINTFNFNSSQSETTYGEFTMSSSDLIEPVLSEKEAELAKIAQRCIIAALDHSRAQKIALVDDNGNVGASAPVLELPPQALRLFAQILGLMSQRRVISLIPQKHELTTQEAAAILNVSRPFLVKQLETGKLSFRKVGRHRRVEFENLMAFKLSMQQNADQALQDLADQAQELGLGY